jgi:hypothetical protein
MKCRVVDCALNHTLVPLPYTLVSLLGHTGFDVFHVTPRANIAVLFEI